MEQGVANNHSPHQYREALRETNQKIDPMIGRTRSERYRNHTPKAPDSRSTIQIQLHNLIARERPKTPHT